MRLLSSTITSPSDQRIQSVRRCTNKLLHILVQKFAVKIIPNCVIDEAFSCLELSSCLVFEDNIIVPPATEYECSLKGLREEKDVKMSCQK